MVTFVVALLPIGLQMVMYLSPMTEVEDCFTLDNEFYFNDNIFRHLSIIGTNVSAIIVYLPTPDRSY